MIRRGAVVAALAVVCATAACTAAHGSAHVTRPSGATHPTTPAPSPSLRPSAAPDAYPPITGKVAVYVTGAPAQHAADRKPFTVGLVVVNGTGHPVMVPDACNGWMDAGLTTRAIPFEPASGGVACAGLALPVGATHVTRRVDTEYGQCSGDPAAAVTLAFPRCLSDAQGIMPSLPRGTYRVAVDTTTVPDSVIVNAPTVTLT